MNIFIMQIIVVLINTYIAITEQKKHIYIVNFLYNFSNLLLYFFTQDTTTVCIYILISLRSFVYIYKDKLYKHKWIPILFILLQILVGIITIENFWQVLTILAPCYVCYYLWFYETTQQLRIGNIINNFLWFIYNFVSGLYIIAISRIITIIVNLITYTYKHKNLRQI